MCVSSVYCSGDSEMKNTALSSSRGLRLCSRYLSTFQPLVTLVSSVHEAEALSDSSADVVCLKAVQNGAVCISYLAHF